MESNKYVSFRYIRENYFRNIKAWRINTGLCYIWACIAALKDEKNIKIIEYGDNSYGSCLHTFIKYNNKYYDSESPLGVKDINNLNWFKDYGLFDNTFDDYSLKEYCNKININKSIKSFITEIDKFKDGLLVER